MHEDGVINTYYACGIHGYTWHSFIRRCVQTSNLPHLCQTGLGGHPNSPDSTEHYRNRPCDYPRGDTACWSLQKAIIISQLALLDARGVKLINNTTWSDIDCLSFFFLRFFFLTYNRLVCGRKWVSAALCIEGRL